MRIQPRRRPIGVFDSGLGGLTVFRALSRRMPQENLIYFGDTAHVPYGSKSSKAVTRYSLEVARFFAARRVKAMVVACNTSSALALTEIEATLKDHRIPVIGVIHPGAGAAVKATRSGLIGIIGTEATIASGVYPRVIGQYSSKVEVEGAACPLFVPLIEEGWWADRVTIEVARRYLKPLKQAGIDTLILGCTHYPLIKGILRKVMGPKVRLIDSAEQTALETENLLLNLGMRRDKGPGAQKFFVSDSPQRFLKLARRLLSVKIDKVLLHPLNI